MIACSPGTNFGTALRTDGAFEHFVLLLTRARTSYLARLAAQKLPGAPAGSGLRHDRRGRRHKSSSRLGGHPPRACLDAERHEGPALPGNPAAAGGGVPGAPSFACIVTHVGRWYVRRHSWMQEFVTMLDMSACRAQACRCGPRTQRPSRARACSWRSTCRRVLPMHPAAWGDSVRVHAA